jgi:hypothetical protein
MSTRSPASMRPVSRKRIEDALVQIDMPRSRDSSFEPRTVLLLWARGVVRGSGVATATITSSFPAGNGG